MNSFTQFAKALQQLRIEYAMKLISAAFVPIAVTLWMKQESESIHQWDLAEFFDKLAKEGTCVYFVEVTRLRPDGDVDYRWLHENMEKWVEDWKDLIRMEFKIKPGVGIEITFFAE